MTKLLKYDPSALDIARAMVAIISPDDAFLFGSRARGDWTNQSDIDVLTIAEQHRDTRAKYQQALQTGQAMATEIYGRPVKIDLVRYSLQDFEYYRQARTHLTHSALKEGINMSGEATGCGNQYPDTEPNNWPDIEQRFTNYQRQILAAENNLEAGLGYEEVGFHFQRALENAMKGFLSYMDYEDGQDNAWIRSHSISDLPEVIRTFPEGQAALGTNDFTFLNDYAINIPYEGVQDPLPDEAEVLRRIMETVDNMMRFIEQDSGTELSRYQPPGHAPDSSRQPTTSVWSPVELLGAQIPSARALSVPRTTHATATLSPSCDSRSTTSGKAPFPNDDSQHRYYRIL